MITSKCFATTSFATSSPYSITFELDPVTRSITSSHCSCQAGCVAQCKHGAAAFAFINEERLTTKTDDRQLWHAPSKLLQSKYPKGEIIEQILGSKNCSETRPFIQCKETENQLTILMNELKMFELSDSSIFKSLSSDKIILVDGTETRRLDFRVERLFDNPKVIDTLPELCELCLEPSHLAFFMKFINCNRDSCVSLCNDTVGQSTKKSWFEARKYRLSASKAKQIYCARKPKTVGRYFFQTLSDNSNLRYGRKTEKIAKEKYMEIIGQIVEEVGVFVHSNYSWLCASPDEIVFLRERARVLEVKCPSSCRDGEISVPYLKNGCLPKTHPYYFQVQIQMFVCNVDMCDFFVFSTADFKLIQILYDADFL